MNSESILLSHLEQIDRITAAIARRALLQPADAADFASWVRTRLIDDDYAILRKFEGRSSMTTYLTVVITNLMRDFRVQRWGRWRSSVEAKRLGPVATRLESLLYRDGYSLREAIQLVRSAGIVDLSDRELALMAERLPARRRARDVGDAPLAQQHSPVSADRDVLAGEQDQAWDLTRTELERALSGLPEEDQLILKLRFWEGLSVADISRSLGLEQKPLYRRIDRLLGRLRFSLEGSGIGRERVASLLDEGGQS